MRLTFRRVRRRRRQAEFTAEALRIVTQPPYNWDDVKVAACIADGKVSDINEHALKGNSTCLRKYDNILTSKVEATQKLAVAHRQTRSCKRAVSDDQDAFEGMVMSMGDDAAFNCTDVAELDGLIADLADGLDSGTADGADPAGGAAVQRGRRPTRSTVLQPACTTCGKKRKPGGRSIAPQNYMKYTCTTCKRLPREQLPREQRKRGAALPAAVAVPVVSTIPAAVDTDSVAAPGVPPMPAMPPRIFCAHVGDLRVADVTISLVPVDGAAMVVGGGMISNDCLCDADQVRALDAAAEAAATHLRSSRSVQIVCGDGVTLSPFVAQLAAKKAGIVQSVPTPAHLRLRMLLAWPAALQMCVADGVDFERAMVVLTGACNGTVSCIFVPSLDEETQRLCGSGGFHALRVLRPNRSDLVGHVRNDAFYMPHDFKSLLVVHKKTTPSLVSERRSTIDDATTIGEVCCGDLMLAEYSFVAR